MSLSPALIGRPLMLVLLAGALAGCGKDAPKQGNASGEVLPAAVSDAMIPEDRLTSQPPLDPGAVRAAARQTAKEEASGSPAPTPEASAAPRPAETATAE